MSQSAHAATLARGRDVDPALHLPDEPVRRRAAWLCQLAGGRTWDDLIEGDDGPTSWLWERWQVLECCGLDQEAFLAIVVAYRRELRLWVAGERTWRQACSGLIGRIRRRLDQNLCRPVSAAALVPVPDGYEGGRRPSGSLRAY